MLRNERSRRKSRSDIWFNTLDYFFFIFENHTHIIICLSSRQIYTYPTKYSNVNAEERKFPVCTFPMYGIYLRMSTEHARALSCVILLNVFYVSVCDVLPQPIWNRFIYHTDFILCHSYYLLFNCLNYSSSFKRHNTFTNFDRCLTHSSSVFIWLFTKR